MNKNFWRRYLKKKYQQKSFFENFVYTDKLTKFLIASEIEKRDDFNIQRNLLFRKKPIYPDLIVRHKDETIRVEIKRFISCSELRRRFKDEIIHNLKPNENTIILFIFPQVRNENAYRIFKIIKGFYILEDYLKELGFKHAKMLCQYIEKDYKKDSEFSFYKFMESLATNIFKFFEK